MRIRMFMKGTGLGSSAVMEFIGAVFCSVDAHNLPRDISSSNNVIYLRLHGRTDWHAY